MELLSIANLSKSYDNIAALRGVNLKISKGEKVALLGSNGAGKSTLVNICAGLRTADYGSTTLFGGSPYDVETKKRFSILPQTLQLPKDLKCKEIIDLVASHFSSPNTDELVAKLDISKLLNKFASHLSGGESRRISFLLAYLGRPEFCLLDEPTANIDIENKEIIYSFLAEYYKDKDKSLLFTSHQMNEVEKIAERLIVLHQGRIILDTPVSDVKESFSLKSICFHSKSIPCDIEGVEKQVKQDNLHTLYCKDTDLVLKELCQNNINFSNLTIRQSSLEEIVLNLWRDNRDSA